MIIEKRNAYICETCRYVTLTVHVDEGVTPFLLACRNPQECRGTATSCMYQLPGNLRLQFAPTHEWYKPKDFMGLTDGEIEHVKQGGVLLRYRTDAPALTHPFQSTGKEPEKP